MYIEALGKDFPLAYTVEAQSKIAARAGRLEDLEKMLDIDAATSTENIVYMVSAMMEAAVNREKVRCQALGETYTGSDAPTYEQLRALTSPRELGKTVMEEMKAAMSGGQKTTVEVKEEKKKNVETTQ